MRLPDICIYQNQVIYDILEIFSRFAAYHRLIFYNMTENNHFDQNSFDKTICLIEPIRAT